MLCRYSIQYANGSSHLFARVERPQLRFAVHDPVTGTFDEPTTLYNGVCDGLQCILGTQTGKSFTLARQIDRGGRTRAADGLGGSTQSAFHQTSAHRHTR